MTAERRSSGTGQMPAGRSGKRFQGEELPRQAERNKRDGIEDNRLNVETET